MASGLAGGWGGACVRTVAPPGPNEPRAPVRQSLPGELTLHRQESHHPPFTEGLGRCPHIERGSDVLPQLELTHLPERRPPGRGKNSTQRCLPRGVGQQSHVSGRGISSQRFPSSPELEAGQCLRLRAAAGSRQRAPGVREEPHTHKSGPAGRAPSRAGLDTPAAGRRPPLRTDRP